MSKIISSFNQVELNNGLKYLVLCDIDNTILHFPECDKYCEEIIKDFHLSDEYYKRELKYLKILYQRTQTPTHTDYDGFNNMIKHIHKTNGKLIFLTARNFEKDSILTRTHLQEIGICPDDFIVHYTGNKISKGEYISSNIDLSNWENIIFIDDCDMHIKKVKDMHPQIICYKFNVYQ